MEDIKKIKEIIGRINGKLKWFQKIEKTFIKKAKQIIKYYLNHH